MACYLRHALKSLVKLLPTIAIQNSAYFGGFLKATQKVLGNAGMNMEFKRHFFFFFFLKRLPSPESGL